MVKCKDIFHAEFTVGNFVCKTIVYLDNPWLQIKNGNAHHLRSDQNYKQRYERKRVERNPTELTLGSILRNKAYFG